MMEFEAMEETDEMDEMEAMDEMDEVDDIPEAVAMCAECKVELDGEIKGNTLYYECPKCHSTWELRLFGDDDLEQDEEGNWRLKAQEENIN